MSEQKTVTLSYEEHERLLARSETLKKIEDAEKDPNVSVIQQDQVIQLYSYYGRVTKETRTLDYIFLKKEELPEFLEKQIQENKENLEHHFELFKGYLEKIEKSEMKQEEIRQNLISLSRYGYNQLPWYVKLFFKKETLEKAIKI